MDIQQLVIYPPSGSGGISINTEDYMCLAKEEQLNDVIIDFYLKYLLNEMLNDTQRSQTHIFSTFFYKRLVAPSSLSGASRRSTAAASSEAAAFERHGNVRNWTKHVNLFAKDFIFVPINASNHWYLAVICYPHLSGPVTKDSRSPIDATLRRQPVPIVRPCILMMDSMSPEGTSMFHKRTANVLREYLACEYQARNAGGPSKLFTDQSHPIQMVDVPQQDNHCDCGLFVLQFVEEFFVVSVCRFAAEISTTKANEIFFLHFRPRSAALSFPSKDWRNGLIAWWCYENERISQSC